MSALREFAARAKAFLTRARHRDNDLCDELRFHLAMMQQDLERRGLDGATARREAPLRVPSSVRIARLGGTVHTADGAPAPGARVFLKTGLEDGHILGEPAVADSLGRFLIAVLEGEQYQVFAERQVFETQAFRSEFSVPVILSATREMPPLRLTVRRRF